MQLFTRSPAFFPLALFPALLFYPKRFYCVQNRAKLGSSVCWLRPRILVILKTNSDSQNFFGHPFTRL